MNPFFGQHLGHRADQRIGVAHGEAQQDLGQLAVRADGAEDHLVLHLPGHDGLGDALGLEGLDQLAQLAQAQPVHRRRAVLFNRRIGLLANGRHHHVVALGPRRLQHQQGKRSVARNQSQP
jgi:hypothetical protein